MNHQTATELEALRDPILNVKSALEVLVLRLGNPLDGREPDVPAMGLLDLAGDRLEKLAGQIEEIVMREGPSSGEATTATRQRGGLAIDRDAGDCALVPKREG